MCALLCYCHDVYGWYLCCSLMCPDLICQNLNSNPCDLKWLDFSRCFASSHDLIGSLALLQFCFILKWYVIHHPTSAPYIPIFDGEIFCEYTWYHVSRGKFSQMAQELSLGNDSWIVSPSKITCHMVHLTIIFNHGLCGNTCWLAMLLDYSDNDLENTEKLQQILKRIMSIITSALLFTLQKYLVRIIGVSTTYLWDVCEFHLSVYIHLSDNLSLKVIWNILCNSLFSFAVTKWSFTKWLAFWYHNKLWPYIMTIVESPDY